MLNALKNQVASYSSFDTVISDSKLAVDCMDFETFLKSGIQCFKAIELARSKWADFVMSGEVKPDADIDDLFWSMLTNWKHRSEKAMEQLLWFENEDFEVKHSGAFRRVVEAAEAVLSHDILSDDDLAELL